MYVITRDLNQRWFMHNHWQYFIVQHQWRVFFFLIMAIVPMGAKLDIIWVTAEDTALCSLEGSICKIHNEVHTPHIIKQTMLLRCIRCIIFVTHRLAHSYLVYTVINNLWESDMPHHAQKEPCHLIPYIQHFAEKFPLLCLVKIIGSMIAKLLLEFWGGRNIWNWSMREFWQIWKMERHAIQFYHQCNNDTQMLQPISARKTVSILYVVGSVMNILFRI